MKRIALIALFATAPATAAAQTTADILAQAIKAYEAFNVEQARPLFAQIISPSNINQVSQLQKVTAYKYLGASYAVLNQPDSAERYFVAALDFDPFTDLDPVKFSAAELGPFNVAKTKIFRVGVMPVQSQVVNPRADSTWYQFTIVTTHRASVTMTLESQNTATKVTEVIFDGQNDGQKVIMWDGRLKSRGGAVADSGTYLLKVTATSSLPLMQGQSQTESQLLRIEQSFDPLEEPLPELPASMLLPEKIPTIDPWLDLAKGVFVGGLAYVLPAVILKDDPSMTASGWSWKPHAYIAVTLGIASGAGSFLYRNSKRSIDGNIQENERRRRQRDAYNREIQARNASRLADMLLIITPLTVR